MLSYPQMFRLRQIRERPRVNDIAAEVASQLQSLELGNTVHPGQSVAISVGSRGLANIELIIKAAVAYLRTLGLEPFVVPAMGSHGGGTAEGQRLVIESYGVTEAFVGCPIRASMDTVIVDETPEGIPVHFDRHASMADHVVVCGRVKPHTGFIGDIESGLMKMMLIGLGKHHGAKIYHRAIQDYSFDQIVRSVGALVLEKCHILAGLAIVENAYHETARIAAVAPDEFIEREKMLLVEARQWMPRLPFDRVDILIIDEIGKNISGSGMDTNVIGRKYSNPADAPKGYPRVKRIIVRGLTEETHGNAAGIGLAEFCTTRAIEQTDVEATRINCITGGHPAAAMLPLNHDSDRGLLDVTLPTIGLTEPENARITWIRDTQHVAEVACSAAYRDEAQQRDDVEILSDLVDFRFGADGNFLPLDDHGGAPASGRD